LMRRHHRIAVTLVIALATALVLSTGVSAAVTGTKMGNAGNSNGK